MGDNWDDSDDDWDRSDDDDDELDKRLGLTKKVGTVVPAFDDEEDLAVKEKVIEEKMATTVLKKKGNALNEKKRKEEERKEEEEIARKAMELENEMEDNMTAEERRILQKKRAEESGNALADDLFGGAEFNKDAKEDTSGPRGTAMNAGDMVKLTDLKDHLKHARKVAQCIKGHGKVHLASAFLKECISECKEALDEDSTNELIKTLNVIKNEKVAAAKRKAKGQAQKAKKDKKAEAKAKQLQSELFGDAGDYDEYDEVGADYEDAFF